MLMAALSATVPNWKQAKCVLEQGNGQTALNHVTEYYSIIKKKKNGILAPATTWISLKVIMSRERSLATKRNDLSIHTTWVKVKRTMLSERSQTINNAYCMIPLISNSRKFKLTHNDKSRSVVASRRKGKEKKLTRSWV